MNKDWVPYVVQQGDHLEKIAFRSGGDADQIWAHEKNAELARKRKSPHVLYPGDILHVPPEPKPGLRISAGTVNRYKARIPTVQLAITIGSDDNRYANQPFEIHGASDGEAPIQGTSGVNGEVEAQLPVWVREVTVRLPQVGLLVPVRIGDLDPVDEHSGGVQRLRNLGYLSREGHVDSEAVRAALLRFQHHRGLKLTGEFDQPTIEALQRDHGA
ncbi:MAG: LysM peptidoglycan-binding domain-containing protein [Polyangiaceae bacterium]|nr:LysM peptidoglycan-binding domain-containing protein [Polyangiaceae bacterium]